MAYNVGAGAQIQIGKESVWGTSVTPTIETIWTAESIDAKTTRADEGNLLASKSPMARDLTTITVDGSISLIARPEPMGAIWKWALGGTDSVTVNDGAISGYDKHVIVAALPTDTMPSYTMVINRKQAVKKYSGVKVNTLKLSAKTGDYVKIDLGLKCKDEATGSTTGLTASSAKPYKCVGASLTLGGTTYDISSIDFTIDNKLQDMPNTFSSGLYKPEPIQGTREFTFDIEMPYDANAETLNATNVFTDTLVSTAILTLLSPSYVTGTSQYKSVITLNNVVIIDQTNNVSGTGVITAKIKAMALSIGATEPVSVAVWDGQSTAY